MHHHSLHHKNNQSYTLEDQLIPCAFQPSCLVAALSDNRQSLEPSLPHMMEDFPYRLFVLKTLL